MEKRKRISGYKQHINDPFVSVSIYHELNNAEKEKIVSEECSKHLAALQSKNNGDCVVMILNIKCVVSY